MTKTTATLHDTCPDCGFAFPSPQARCRSAAACAKRKAARDAQPAVDAALNVEPAAETEPAPIRVKLTSAGQEAVVDAVLTGVETTGLRSGRAGHWLVVQPSEIHDVTSLLSSAEAARCQPGRTILAHLCETVAA